MFCSMTHRQCAVILDKFSNNVFLSFDTILYYKCDELSLFLIIKSFFKHFSSKLDILFLLVVFLSLD